MSDKVRSPPGVARRRWRTWWLLALVIALVLFHAPLLRLCIPLVSVHEPLPAQVDAVLIFGGDDCHAAAARWVKSGFAHTILLPRRLADRNVALGIIPPRDFFSRKQLLELGVTDEAIQCLDDEGPRGEWRFLRLLDAWLHDHPRAKIVILCDGFNSRLVRYAIGHVLSNEDAQRVYVSGLPSLDYDERNWWRSRRGAVTMFGSLLAQACGHFLGEDNDEPITWDVDAYEKGLKH